MDAPDRATSGGTRSASCGKRGGSSRKSGLWLENPESECQRCEIVGVRQLDEGARKAQLRQVSMQRYSFDPTKQVREVGRRGACVATPHRMAHPVFLTAGDEERLVRVADDVVVADMPDEEAPIGERELEPWREALGAFADRSSFTDVFDQADGEIEEARTANGRGGAPL